MRSLPLTSALLPTEMNVEKPMPMERASSRIAMPSAPPRRAPPGPAGLAETGGEDGERAHALGHAVVDNGLDVPGRHGDDGEIDRPFDRAQRREEGDAVDLRRVRIDGVERAAEAGVAEVVQDRRAEVAGIAAGADDGDRLRREDRLHRRVRGLLRALRGDARRGLGRRDREGDVDRALARAARGVEAAAEEDVEHALVLRQYLSLEARDTVRPRDLGELLEQLRADAAAVVAVGDRERALGGVGAAREGEVVRDGDDLVADFADHAEVAHVVD